jgi:hypothetical protein
MLRPLSSCSCSYQTAGRVGPRVGLNTVRQKALLFSAINEDILSVLAIAWSIHSTIPAAKMEVKK